MNRAAAWALLAAAGAAAGGCLERQVSITSEPAGAEVWLNDQHVGRTPLSTGFLFYGVYDVRVRKEGYEPVIAAKKARQPWYEMAPFDLAASAVPARIRTDIKWHFDLQPLGAGLDPEAERAGLLERARDLRAEAPIAEAPVAPEQPAPVEAPGEPHEDSPPQG